MRLSPVFAVSLLLLLTACDPGGSDPAAPVSSPSPSATVGEEAVEEAPEPQPTTILLRTDFVAILDENDAVIAQFDYFDAPTAAISAFTEILGGAPTVTPFEGNSTQWPGDYYSWDAFTLVDWVGGPAVAYGQDYGISVSAASVRGLAVETVGGVTVGSTGAQVIAAGGIAQDFSYDGTSLDWYQVDIVPGTDPEWSEWEDGPRIFVNAAVATPGGTVTTLSAPVANYGP